MVYHKISGSFQEGKAIKRILKGKKKENRGRDMMNLSFP